MQHFEYRFSWIILLLFWVPFHCALKDRIVYQLPRSIKTFSIRRLDFKISQLEVLSTLVLILFLSFRFPNNTLFYFFIFIVGCSSKFSIDSKSVTLFLSSLNIKSGCKPSSMIWFVAMFCSTISCYLQLKASFSLTGQTLLQTANY
jgi:hypothetical protein